MNETKGALPYFPLPFRCLQFFCFVRSLFALFLSSSFPSFNLMKYNEAKRKHDFIIKKRRKRGKETKKRGFVVFCFIKINTHPFLLCFILMRTKPRTSERQRTTLFIFSFFCFNEVKKREQKKREKESEQDPAITRMWCFSLFLCCFVLCFVPFARFTLSFHFIVNERKRTK